MEKKSDDANSDWSGKIMKKVYGIEPNTIYPPVASEFSGIPWDKRENGFIVLARLYPQKRIYEIITILGKVRERGWDIHLHILGRIDNSNYARRLIQLSAQHSKWVYFEDLVLGEEKQKMITQHKYSISGRENEPFGIAVAETVKAGCITWGPNGGGQVEIVNHPSLIYVNMDDAVRKIENVLKNNESRMEIQKHLAEQSMIYSEKRFQKEIKDVVREFFQV